MNKLPTLAAYIAGAAACWCALACSAGPTDSIAGDGDGDGDGTVGTGGNGSGVEIELPGEVDGSGGSNVVVPPPPWRLPNGFTPSELGGYRRVGPLTADIEPLTECGYELRGVVRDFKARYEHPEVGGGFLTKLRPGGHPDFEAFGGQGEKGLVETQLGTDGLPVLTAGPHNFVTSKASFDQWYRTVEGVNQAFVIEVSLETNGANNTFMSRAFFPVDGAGWGEEGFHLGGEPHNYHFTTEFHTAFRYEGGETFQFIGDDDVWVFIAGKLAIDLGGVHAELSQEVKLDEFATVHGLVKGRTYSLDIFHAERAFSSSNFRIDSTLQFTNCGTLPPVK